MPAAEPHIVAHFVPLSVIMSDHGGDLASYMAASGSSDVVGGLPEGTSMLVRMGARRPGRDG